MGSVKNLSERISYKKHDGFTTVVISPRLEDSRQFMLTFWIFAWTFCGAAFITQLFADHSREMKLMILVFLSFWAYYEYRIGYVWFWRRKGVELIKIEADRFIYKRSLRSYGKAYEYYFDNIKDFRIPNQKNSFSGVLNNSFWVIGGERVAFDYQDKEVRFGIQLNDKEANELLRFLKSEMK